MKFNPVLLAAWVILGGLTSLSQPVPSDPIAENLFPPDFILQYQSEIELSDEQRSGLIAQAQKGQERFQEMDQQRRKEADRLAALLKGETFAESEIIAQFDRLLDQERELRRAQLGLAAGLMGKLTPQQRTKLREIRKKIAAGLMRSPEELRRALEAKLHKIEDGVRRWQDEGRDPSAIGAIMAEFEPLMRQAKHKEAEAILDQALQRLNQPL